FPKEKTIGQVIVDLKIYNKENAVMIGDTIYDIKGAQQHNMPSIGVLYGFGKNQDIKDARPTFIAENVDELRNLLF
ncbi:MAG: HAD hydrolase-like protein, partial [Flavobacteriales bacterium]|nr:HAD hydrolase-like protein [Flavobacteriales bacterium]